MSLAQVFSCEFCEIFEDTFFTEHLQEPAAVFEPTSLNVLELMGNKLEKTFFKSVSQYFFLVSNFSKDKVNVLTR